jgi:hypothetical protein
VIGAHRDFSESSNPLSPGFQGPAGLLGAISLTPQTDYEPKLVQRVSPNRGGRQPIARNFTARCCTESGASPLSIATNSGAFGFTNGVFSFSITHNRPGWLECRHSSQRRLENLDSSANQCAWQRTALLLRFPVANQPPTLLPRRLALIPLFWIYKFDDPLNLQILKKDQHEPNLHSCAKKYVADIDSFSGAIISYSCSTTLRSVQFWAANPVHATGEHHV